MKKRGHIWLSVLGLAAAGGLALGAAPALAAGRVLTDQDVVIIKVVNQPDMDTTTRVGADGTINFPYVGRIKAAGRTEDDLARAIEQRLASRQIVTDPHVLVETSGFRHAGQRPGPGRIAGHVHARSRHDAVAIPGQGGRLARDSAVRSSSGATAGSSDVTTARTSLTGKINADRILIRNNDEIYRRPCAAFYYMYGYRRSHRRVSADPPLTVQQAIAIAGGLSPLGTDSRLRIKRKVRATARLRRFPPLSTIRFSRTIRLSSTREFSDRRRS